MLLNSHEISPGAHIDAPNERLSGWHRFHHDEVATAQGHHALRPWAQIAEKIRPTSHLAIAQPAPVKKPTQNQTPIWWTSISEGMFDSPCSDSWAVEPRGARPETADSLFYEWHVAGCDAHPALYSAGSPPS
jgi:hypothetical protein